MNRTYPPPALFTRNQNPATDEDILAQACVKAALEKKQELLDFAAEVVAELAVEHNDLHKSMFDQPGTKYRTRPAVLRALGLLDEMGAYPKSSTPSRASASEMPEYVAKKVDQPD